MRLGGIAAAAIEVLEDVKARPRPVADALRDWGLAHRFAGSGDRARIGDLVYDAVRWQASSAWQIDSDRPRAVILATLVCRQGIAIADLLAAFADDRHAPEPPTTEQQELLRADRLDDAPAWVQADVPEWVAPLLADNFDEEWPIEAAALAARAPLDIRVNTLKVTRSKVERVLARVKPQPTPISPVGLRILPDAETQRLPNLKGDPDFKRGWFDIQDESSQIASLLVDARPGEQVLDYCAGGGGKTLALAATMANKGQLFAYDLDRGRLGAVVERAQRAGVRNMQICRPDDAAALAALSGRMDRVLVDAPCTGSGTWRRHPELKWKLTPETLEQRISDQQTILAAAAAYVKPGGLLTYATCSVFAEENEGQVVQFAEQHPDFRQVTVADPWESLFGQDKPSPWSADFQSITMTPASTGTDGFFVAMFERRTG